jgi:hypothetical protein
MKKVLTRGNICVFKEEFDQYGSKTVVFTLKDLGSDSSLILYQGEADFVHDALEQLLNASQVPNTPPDQF